MPDTKIRGAAPDLAINPSLLRQYSSSSVSDDTQGHSEDFQDIAGELRRRKRKADSKRRQYGNTFIDHLLVTVRGGKGGSGACALQATLKGSGPSAPCGGNGGSGGSVYITTSPSLSSLTTLKKRVIGGQGASGSGAHKHGRRGEDVLITVPVGTIVKEIRREGEEERSVREENDLGLDEEEKRKRKWQRWIVTHPSAGGEVSPEEYKDAEDLLKRENRWNIRTPSLEEQPPIELDLDQPLTEPVLLAKGGLGGLGNPFFNSPRVSSKGFLPPTQTFEFELKLLADVGLVGFPNSGKSTILRCLTGKSPEIAGYEFTTLNPQIGVVRVFDNGGWSSDLGVGEEIEESWVKREKEEVARLLGEEVFPDTTSRYNAEVREGGRRGGKKGEVERIRFTISDNPGLLPMASENVGLGHSFLRSIERSPVLVYVLDLSKTSPVEDLRVLKNELESYKKGLSGRAGVVVLNKGDMVVEQEGKEKIKKIEEYLQEGGEEMEVIVLSGKYNLGIQGLVNTLVGKVESAREERKREMEERERMKAEPKRVGSFGVRRLEV
uniref:GTPase n=1 Tax=Kwoniella bestiolae CBS 10118 TaxID=1296100 RepID=A0A1B9FV50_9TREE|nr:GTPase [Kwoniella bestiolae CBS 10118]OCF22646.1 GTPase [Kwoniella bestiolae CBS 10118]